MELTLADVDLRRETDIEQLRRVALAQQTQIEQLLRALRAKCKELEALKGSEEELQQTLALVEQLTRQARTQQDILGEAAPINEFRTRCTALGGTPWPPPRHDLCTLDGPRRVVGGAWDWPEDCGDRMQAITVYFHDAEARPMLLDRVGHLCETIGSPSWVTATEAHWDWRFQEFGIEWHAPPPWAARITARTSCEALMRRQNGEAGR